MRESQDSVNQIQEERKKRGEIKDISQSGKAIVGSMFAQLLHYLLLKNKEVGNIPAHILVTRSKAQAERMFEEDFKVYIGGEKQTPDCDMIIYNKNTKKFIILSLKTSLRERAGQTFKWKLLWEIANSSNTKLKDKFDIKYKGKVTPNICFVTADFYHEIDSSQHRGMFKFFDGSFIAKPNVEHDLVMSLSDLPAYIKKSLCR
ncbi:MAG: hypothetical protein HAW61_04175 [Candidatus Portiera sp.]|nr:hypothetical protein [Portiera sp.]